MLNSNSNLPNLAVPNSGLKLFFFFVKSQKKYVIAFVLLCLLVSTMPSIDSILLKKITNTLESFSTSTKSGDIIHTMLFWAVIYGLWWESANIGWRMYDYLYLKLMPPMKGKIIDVFYDYTQHHSHKFFQDNLAGHITNRINEAAKSFEMIFSILTEKIIKKTAATIFALATMYMVHPKLAFIFSTWIAAFVGMSFLFSDRISKYSTDFARNRSMISGKIVDAIANISAIRMFNQYRSERKYLQKYIDETVKSDQILQWFMFKLRYFLGLSCSIMIFFILYYLGVLRSTALITTGDCVLIVTLCIAIVTEIWDLTQEVGDIFEEIGTFRQSISLLQPYIVNDTKDAKSLEITEGKLEFRNVTFYYLDNKDLFINKSVIIEGKQKVGLVGFSGSGKSTFVNLITRLHDVENGEILIDGQNIKYVSQSSLRELISFIPQEPILFHRSIRENIIYGKSDSSDEEITQAAKLAHIHDVIMDLPAKYDTLCGERGNNLSGGQRQRIVIARAILKNAPILILDEATSSLDSETESLIQESLKYLMQNKTVLVIAHRLSTLLNMDRIMVFDQGSIIEDGTHEELLKKGKLYKKLWKSQVKGFISDTP